MATLPSKRSWNSVEEKFLLDLQIFFVITIICDIYVGKEYFLENMKDRNTLVRKLDIYIIYYGKLRREDPKCFESRNPRP